MGTLSSLMFTKTFEQAYKGFDGRLPIHVRFMLDEFANLGDESPMRH